MITETVDNSPVPKIGNSVSTDVEILYGVTSILGMILTSDQYLSVNRMYDRMAAIRQQEAANEKATTKQVETILSSVDDYLKKNPNSAVVGLLQKLLR